METKTNVGKKHRNIDYSKKILEVKELKKYFTVGVGGNKLVVPAVDDISFDIYKREVFGLVGESGCGKTTTGRTIIKLYNPTAGSVKLNDVQIGAGDLTFINRIKEIKKELKFDIIKLDERKLAIYNIKKEYDFKIDELKHQIKLIEDKQKKEIDLVKEPILEYKKAQYTLKEKYKLDVEGVKYNFILKKGQILDETKNEILIEFENEKKIEKNKYDNKLIGLKESAALKKEEIAARIEDLKVEYSQNLEALNEKFLPLIEQGEEEIKPKSEARAEITILRTKMKDELAELKAEYLQKREDLVAPDKEAVKVEEAAIKERYSVEIAEIKNQIITLVELEKTAIAALPPLVETPEEGQIKRQKIKELKLKANEEIRQQKAKIADAKRINNSKEAIEMSRMMQMIFQDPISSLNPRMTVREIVGEGLIIQGNHSQEYINDRVAEVLEIVGLSKDHAMRYPHEFSGGQRQRIGIARALIMSPNFIIADEPISALDVSIQAQVINLLKELKDKLDLTILFIAHDLSVVRFFCDRIAVMYAGKIMEMAESDELFRNPMHPYTKSLLSAIPQPDPDYERERKRVHYNPRLHDYRIDKPELREIADGHYVYANEPEFKELVKEYNKQANKGR